MWSSNAAHDARVRTIALYRRDYAVHETGALVAVSADYVCYGLKGTRTPAARARDRAAPWHLA